MVKRKPRSQPQPSPEATPEPVWRAFDRWMFGWGSPVAMGVARILFGLLAFVNLLMLTYGWSDWFTEPGFVPLQANRIYYGEYWRINVLAFAEQTWITALVFVVTGLAAVTTTLGLFTRLSTIVLAVGMISIHHRNGFILHGGDTVLRQYLILLAVAPCGRAVSLDRWFARRLGLAPQEPQPVSLWPQRLMCIQVSIIYYTTVWHKFHGTYWKDGTAIWYPLNLNEFDRFWIPEFLFHPGIIALLTYGTLITQFAIATLAYWKPARKWVLLGGLAMHGFIEYAMNIPLFAFLMWATYVAFYDGEEIVSWWERLKARWNLRGMEKTPWEAEHV